MAKHKFTKAEREAIFFSAGGICHLCKQPIHPGEDWDCSHVDIPEEHGGDEVAPAHRTKCHRKETSEVTIPLIAKVRRERQRHIGAFQSRTPMPCGRGSSRSKGMDGKIKRRMRGSEREAILRAENPSIDYSLPPIMRQFVAKEEPAS